MKWRLPSIVDSSDEFSCHYFNIHEPMTPSRQQRTSHYILSFPFMRTSWKTPNNRFAFWNKLSSPVYEEEEGHRELILKIRKVPTKLTWVEIYDLFIDYECVWQNLPLKDFSEEVRARKDLAKFLVQPVVLLDLTDTCMYESKRNR